MNSPAVTRVRATAERIAAILSALPDVQAVGLFGSAARGDLNDASDIDLLVLGSDPELRPTALLRSIPERFRYANLSLSYYTIGRLRDLFAAATPFAKHLRLEAKILYDPSGTLESILRTESAHAEIDVRRELHTRLAQLRLYEDLDMFANNFLFVLSHLYSIGKSVVMLVLVTEGTPEFNKTTAFASFAERHQEFAADVKLVDELRPFHLLVTRGIHQELPFGYYDAEVAVRDAISAIYRIASVLK